MNITYSDYVYLNNIDVLIRVYANMDNRCLPEDNFLGEILFHERVGLEHIRFSAEFPAGLVNALEYYIGSIPKDSRIQVSNELHDTVGLLTSCREHFSKGFTRECLPLLV